MKIYNKKYYQENRQTALDILANFINGCPEDKEELETALYTLEGAIKELSEALKEISECKGTYNRDRLEHATNCIKNMSDIAFKAITKVGK